MVSICFYFQVHQPRRLRNYSVFDIKKNQEYFDDEKNKEIALKVARKCYLPMNRMLLDLIKKHKGDFKVSFSISGIALEQFEEYSPDVLQSFKDLADTGCVEFLAETYYHSLSFLYNQKEFREQVQMHREKIKELFGYTPQVFRNTELIYNNELPRLVERMGFKGVATEGADHIMQWRSPNFLYKPVSSDKVKVLLKNYKLSDDIAFRFGNKSWNEYPLTVEKFEQWISAVNGNGNIINLFMDYETFGEHQWEDTGIFEFMRHLPEALLRNPDNNFVTVGEAIDRYETVGDLDVPHTISWADIERDTSAWLGNRMQHAAIDELYRIYNNMGTNADPETMKLWRYMTTSDHFYYMCTKWFSDGDVHKYFNPYDSPYEAYIAFMNVMNDLAWRLKANSVDESQVVELSERPSEMIASQIQSVQQAVQEPETMTKILDK